MSEVNPADFRLIRSEDDVFDTYAGAGNAVKSGLEVELAFFRPDRSDLRTMTPAENEVVKKAAAAVRPGDWLRNEPTAETLEISSIAGGAEDLEAVLADTETKIRVLTAEAAKQGLKRSYFQELPEKTAAALLENLVDIPRYRAFFGPPREDMLDIARYFAVCKSVQVSVSYRDPAHMLENVRRLYALAPFLFLLTDNSAGFAEGQPLREHPGMYYRAYLEERGGVPPYLFTAKTGEEYLRAHIEHVMTNRLFVYYDETGTLQRLPSGAWTSLRELVKRGLNTASNYYLSESILWPDVKIAALKDARNRVSGHRFEARMFGVGAHQHRTALLITAGLAFYESFAQEIDLLLYEFGLDVTNPPLMRKNLTQTYHNARHHGGKYMDISYGTGKLPDFARRFADSIERVYAGTPFERNLTPLLAICRTGCSDAKINAGLFPALADVLKFQKSYDSAIFENPDSCALMLFESRLKPANRLNCAANS